MQVGPSLSPSLRSDLGLALFWCLASALASLALFPYAFASLPGWLPPLRIPLAILVLAQTLQSAILVFVLAFLGLRCRSVTGLDSPLARSFLARQPLPSDARQKSASAAGLGALIGFIVLGCVFALAALMPAPYAPPPEVALWKRLLAAFYGGVTEECLLRLFLMSGIIWLLLKINGKRFRSAPVWIFWLGLALAAFLFGAGHIPAAALIWPLTPLVVLRTVVLNGFGGILFGWLFWRWGFEYAVIAHFCADLVLHGLGGS